MFEELKINFYLRFLLLALHSLYRCFFVCCSFRRCRCGRCFRRQHHRCVVCLKLNFFLNTLRGSIFGMLCVSPNCIFFVLFFRSFFSLFLARHLQANNTANALLNIFRPFIRVLISSFGFVSCSFDHMKQRDQWMRCNGRLVLAKCGFVTQCTYKTWIIRIETASQRKSERVNRVVCYRVKEMPGDRGREQAISGSRWKSMFNLNCAFFSHFAIELCAARIPRYLCSASDMFRSSYCVVESTCARYMLNVGSLYCCCCFFIIQNQINVNIEVYLWNKL